jgi:hypothetical protein
VGGELNLVPKRAPDIDLNRLTVGFQNQSQGYREHNVLANPTSDADGNTNSDRFDNLRKDLITTSEVGVRGSFRLADVLNRVSATGSIFQLNSKNAYGFSDFAGFAGNLYSPTTVAPAAGLVVKPTKLISLYANYIEGAAGGRDLPRCGNDANAGRIAGREEGHRRAGCREAFHSARNGR